MGSPFVSHIGVCIFCGLAFVFITVSLLSPAWSDSKSVQGVDWFRFESVNVTKPPASIIRGFTNVRRCAYGLCQHSRRKYASLESYEKKTLGCLLASFIFISTAWIWGLLLFCVSCNMRIPVPILIFLGGLCGAVALVIYGIHMKDVNDTILENATTFGYSFFMATGAVFSCVLSCIAGIAMVCVGNNSDNTVHPQSEGNKVEDDGEPSKEQLYNDNQEDIVTPVAV